nr:ankyrin repeat-containing protein BDA1-like [Ziziphus jujuba var. spinosa]
MDNRLFEAAQTGNIQILHQLLAENPFVLHTIELSSQGFNPLDIASTAGHVEFVKEIIRLRPDFAKQVNQDGFSPIHIAAAIGNMDTVREFMKVDQKLCRLEGRNRWTALHYAASRGKVDTIQEMLLACPESIEDVTVQNETALHLAVKNCQFQAINFMVTWVREMKKDEILDMKDEHGNSILHLATWRKQRQVVEWLISNPGTNPLPLEVNAVNKSGLTALDVLLIFASEAGDREIEEILRNAGARRARDMIMSLSTTPPYEITNNNIQTPSAANGPTTSDLCADNLVNYFKFKRGRDSPSDARTALLVIAVLVTTATFQAGLNPPGGVWQDTESNGGPRNPSYEAGRSIMGSYHPVTYLLFMVFNSIGFSVSIYMITVLISNFPFLWEFRACVLALYFTYNIAITSMAPNSLKVFLTAFSSALPSLSPLIAKLVSKLIMASRGFLTHLKHRFPC